MVMVKALEGSGMAWTNGTRADRGAVGGERSCSDLESSCDRKVKCLP